MRWSLKTRAAVATALVVALVIMVLAVVAQYYAYTSLKEVLQSQQEERVKLVAERLDDQFEGRTVVLRRLARLLTPILERPPGELKA
ncbi:hypothetical protein [Cupriavidus sp. D39]|uniref:hypothetical protein n=1 Tax=Cupriavidus sp. D39 TaxID=2997877 RepID=UPI0022703F83|nr:hypothetical protein [Cupriavidus sp. D39]MCY0854138.1 hypothetical protein [Cupriavidus sp. D39]